jgi:SanA protein
MKNELIKKGIPENRIFLDFAGFRTLDSVVTDFRGLYRER